MLNSIEIFPDPGITDADGHPADRAFALPELITPQIDHFDESRLWRDLTPQFLMVEGVGPSDRVSVYEAGLAENFPRGGSRASTRSAAPTEGTWANFRRSAP